MKTLVATFLFLGLWLFCAPAAARAQTSAQERQDELHLVNKIYIQELGTSDEAARLRLLLEDKLSERGFTVVYKPEEADASLTGIASAATAVKSGTANVSVMARLISAAGTRLWSINLPRPVTFASAFKLKNLKWREPVEQRAEELAEKLRDDWEKSAKAAGAKPGK